MAQVCLRACVCVCMCVLVCVFGEESLYILSRAGVCECALWVCADLCARTFVCAYVCTRACVRVWIRFPFTFARHSRWCVSKSVHVQVRTCVVRLCSHACACCWSRFKFTGARCSTWCCCVCTRAFSRNSWFACVCVCIEIFVSVYTLIYFVYVCVACVRICVCADHCRGIQRTTHQGKLSAQFNFLRFRCLNILQHPARY